MTADNSAPTSVKAVTTTELNAQNALMVTEINYYVDNDFKFREDSRALERMKAMKAHHEQLVNEYTKRCDAVGKSYNALVAKVQKNPRAFAKKFRSLYKTLSKKYERQAMESTEPVTIGLTDLEEPIDSCGALKPIEEWEIPHQFKVPHVEAPSVDCARSAMSIALSRAKFNNAHKWHNRSHMSMRGALKRNEQLKGVHSKYKVNETKNHAQRTALAANIVEATLELTRIGQKFDPAHGERYWYHAYERYTKLVRHKLQEIRDEVLVDLDPSGTTLPDMTFSGILTNELSARDFDQQLHGSYVPSAHNYSVRSMNGPSANSAEYAKLLSDTQADALFKYSRSVVGLHATNSSAKSIMDAEMSPEPMQKALPAPSNDGWDTLTSRGKSASAPSLRHSRSYPELEFRFSAQGGELKGGLANAYKSPTGMATYIPVVNPGPSEPSNRFHGVPGVSKDLETVLPKPVDSQLAGLQIADPSAAGPQSTGPKWAVPVSAQTADASAPDPVSPLRPKFMNQLHATPQLLDPKSQAPERVYRTHTAYTG